MTETIYNVINKNVQINCGVVEIIDIYGGNYFNIYVDGKFIVNIQKRGFMKTLLNRKVLEEITKKSGVSEEDLIFIFFSQYHYAYRFDNNYDANDYNYQKILNLVKVNGSVKDYEFKLIAKGLSNLENVDGWE